VSQLEIVKNGKTLGSINESTGEVEITEEWKNQPRKTTGTTPAGEKDKDTDGKR
jgi:hypothetical protein